jgi:hypothetical protein
LISPPKREQNSRFEGYNGFIAVTHLFTQYSERFLFDFRLCADADLATVAVVILGVPKPAAAKEYVRYEDGVCITTNTIEGYFSILKRGINGVYHHVGKQHLQPYSVI